jgi:molybdopterin-containing oxidoreductase family membrane subunit
VLVDMGRPDRLMNVFLYARPQSPIFWDINGLNGYLIVAAVYFFVRLIPDLAILRDRKVGRVGLYRLLALGYRGTPKQRTWLAAVSTVTAILLILFAVIEDTIISYIFATTLQPGWHSTIFGPYFVVGAVFSGIGALVVVMVIVRKVFHLEAIVTEAHFDKLGLLFLAVAGLMIYFTFNLYFVNITGGVPAEMAPVMDNLRGPYAIYFWGMVVLGLLLPAGILAFPGGRKIPALFFSACLVVVAMWVNRYITIMPTLNNPRLPWAHSLYQPTWVEISVSAGCLALFALALMVLTRLFPVVSIWEVQYGIDSIPVVVERLESYQPSGKLADASGSSSGSPRPNPG